MAYQEDLIFYREQMEIATLEGVVSRESMEGCYFIVMVDPETGDKIITNKSGIVKLLFTDYPELGLAVENLTPIFLDAARQEYQKQKALELAATESSNNLPEETVE